MIAAMHAQPAAREVLGADVPPKRNPSSVCEGGRKASSAREAGRFDAHSAISAMAKKVVPKSSGSVIGVLWRYSTSGFNMSSAEAVTPPTTDPVARQISVAIAQ